MAKLFSLRGEGGAGLQQIGPDMDGFFAAWEQGVLPEVRG